MEFWSALLGAVIGGAASLGAAMWTIKRAAAQAESDWRRGKKAEALVEFDLMINVLAEAAMAEGGDYPRTTALLSGAEWTRATRAAILWAPRLYREVHGVTGAFWDYANEDTRDEMGMAYAHSQFEIGMRQELGLQSVTEATEQVVRLDP